MAKRIIGVTSHDPVNVSTLLPNNLIGQSGITLATIKTDIMKQLQFTEFQNLPEGAQTTVKMLRELENQTSWVDFLRQKNLESHDLIDIDSFDTLLGLFLHLKLLHKTERYAALKIILDKLVNQSLSAQGDLATLVEKISLSAPVDEDLESTQEEYKLVLLTAVIAYLFNTHNLVAGSNDDDKKSDISRTLKELQGNEGVNDNDESEHDDRNTNEDDSNDNQQINLYKGSDPLDDWHGTDSPYLTMAIEDILESDPTDGAFRQFCLCMNELKNLDLQKYVTIVTTIVNGMQGRHYYATKVSGIEDLEELLRNLIKEPKKLPVIQLLLANAKKSTDDRGGEILKTLQSGDQDRHNETIKPGDEKEFIA